MDYTIQNATAKGSKPYDILIIRGKRNMLLTLYNIPTGSQYRTYSGKPKADEVRRIPMRQLR